MLRESRWPPRSRSQNVLPVTPEMRANMISGKPLKWKVTALDANGKEIANSSMEQFKVK